MKKRAAWSAPEAKAAKLSKHQQAVLDAAKLCQRDGQVCTADLACVARLLRGRIYIVVAQLTRLNLWPYTCVTESLAPPEVLEKASSKPEPPPGRKASAEEWRAWGQREAERMERFRPPPNRPSKRGKPVPWSIVEPKGGDE